jgi:hypothetical protein
MSNLVRILPNLVINTMPLAGDHELVQDEGPRGSPHTVPTMEFASPPSMNPDLDNFRDDALVHFRKMENVLGDALVPRLAQQELGDELHTGSVKELATFVVAEREPCWRAFMMVEL